MITTLFVPLFLYQLKHFIADYPAQSNRFMLGKFYPARRFILPLLAHVGVHAVGTFLITLAFTASSLLGIKLALFDAAVHFVMDRIKASPRLMGRWKPLTAPDYLEAQRTGNRKALHGNILFWNSLGLDQMVHHLTHYVCIWWIMGGM